jgi:hypothetical protein
MTKPGSSASNPIVIDAPEIGAPSLPPVGSSNPKVISGGCRNGSGTKPRRRRRKRQFSEYHPSRASRWRPAPYADQSDVESVLEWK